MQHGVMRAQCGAHAQHATKCMQNSNGTLCPWRANQLQLARFTAAGESSSNRMCNVLVMPQGISVPSPGALFMLVCVASICHGAEWLPR